MLVNKRTKQSIKWKERKENINREFKDVDRESH